MDLYENDDVDEGLELLNHRTHNTDNIKPSSTYEGDYDEMLYNKLSQRTLFDDIIEVFQIGKYFLLLAGVIAGLLAYYFTIGRYGVSKHPSDRPQHTWDTLVRRIIYVSSIATIS